MENFDTAKMKKTELATALGDAMAGYDETKPETVTALEEATMAFAEHIQDSVMQEAKGLRDSLDTTILASRGDKVLTGEETAYYAKIAKAIKSGNPKMELQNLDVVMPYTTIQRVFEDLTVAHPLLNAISFQNTTQLTEWLFNEHETQLAQWGELTDAIVKEITSGFSKMDMGMFKLSAFLPIANAMLDLGPQWLDRYIRTILAEAIALALEDAIIQGTGKEMPIGMNRSVADNVVVTAGVYPVRSVVTLNSFDPVNYGAFIADNLATTKKGNPRAISNILMVCNHQDYLRKIMPATTVRTPEGRYVNNVFPFPTTVVQSTRVPAGKAVLGLAERYFMGIGAGTGGGRLEYSDEYRFLEDQRVYRIKLYGNGRPMDDVSFAYADISGLEPLVQQVYVTNMVEALPEG